MLYVDVSTDQKLKIRYKNIFLNYECYIVSLRNNNKLKPLHQKIYKLEVSFDLSIIIIRTYYHSSNLKNKRKIIFVKFFEFIDSFYLIIVVIN